MINLIPNEEKKKMIKDFYFRLLVVLFFILGCSVLVATVAIAPSYVFSSLNKNVASQKSVNQKNIPEPSIDQNTLSQISDLNGKLALIENAEKNKYDISIKVINEIISQKTPGIQINDISYKKDPSLGKSIIVKGIAASREALLVFRQALQNDKAWKNVNLPISNFVAGSNISFDLSLIPSI